MSLLSVSTAENQPAWRWQCEDSKCVKMKHDPESTEPALSLEACKMFCNPYGTYVRTIVLYNNKIYYDTVNI